MSQNSQNRNRTRNTQEDEGWSSAAVIGGILGGAAAIGTAWYLLSRGKETEKPSVSNTNASRFTSVARNRPGSSSTSSDEERTSRNMSDHLSDLMQRATTSDSQYGSGDGRIRFESPASRGLSDPPPNPDVNNLNGLLHDIYVRYIAFRDYDFEHYYGVVSDIFRQMHQKMKEVDPYYNKYSSTVQYAGSHPDRLRINKPDEFDIDIVINLPLSIDENPRDPTESDIVIEPKDPGFVQLKMGVQYDRLPYRDGDEWLINKTAYKWKDERNYLLRSKFTDWFKGVRDRALNQFVENSTLPPTFYVGGVAYTVTTSESGPALTLYVENSVKNFKLDVDLVPALRFPIARWPVNGSYRHTPAICAGAGRDYWMVVPKPNKSGATEQDRNRSWRVALHDQERMLMHDTNNMRQAIRLIKKLRDAQNMKKIASYYIKTMFFWEAIKHQNDPEFWQKNPAFLFKLMVKNFHEYLVAGRIPYFWNQRNNLIGHVSRVTLDGYAKVVGDLLEVLDQPREYKMVAKFLLTADEFKEYNRLLNI